MKKFFQTLSRPTIRLFEISLGVLIVLMIGVGFMLWQMSRQPFDLMFAEGYIERALSTEQYRVNFDDVDLKWPKMRGPLRLDIKGVQLVTPAGDTALSVAQVDIGISSAYLLLGLIRPVSLHLENPVFRIVQSDDGNVTFLFQGKKVAEDNPRPADEQVTSIFHTLSDPGEENILRRFRSLIVDNARLVLEDAETGEDTTVALLNGQFRRTRARATINADLMLDETFNDGVGGISLALDYDRATRDLSTNMVFKNLGPKILTKIFTGNDFLERQAGNLDGNIVLSLDSARQLTEFSGKVNIHDAEIYWPQEYDTPIQLDEFDLQLHLDPATQVIKSETFTTTVQGVPLDAVLSVQIRDIGYQFLLDARVPEIEQKTLETFFPKSELDGELAEWLVHKMEGGVFRNVAAKVPFGLKKEKDGAGTPRWAFLFDERDMHVTFEAEGVNLTYQDTLKPGLDIKGAGVFDGDTLEVNGESGRIEDVQASNVKVVVSNIVEKGGGYADIALDAKGPLSTVLAYIADEPIAMAEEVGFDPGAVKGHVDLHITVGLPTVDDVPKEEVKVKVSGTLGNLYLPDVVEGLPLSEGPLTLETGAGFFTLKGDAKIDGQPVTLDMMQYFDAAGRDFATKVDARVTSNADLRAKFGVDLSDYISGNVPLDIAYIDDGKGRESVAVKGDLGPAQLHITPFNYTKPAGQAGSLSLNAVLEKGRLTRVSELTINAPELSIRESSLSFRPLSSGGVELSGGHLPVVQIAQSKGKADFSISPAGVLSIEALAPAFDARPFLQTSGRRKQEGAARETGQPMVIDLVAEKVTAMHDQAIDGMKLYAELDAESDITRLELSGKTGKSDVLVLFRPDPQTGKRFFRLETLDAGAVLAASGLYENVRGGSLLVFGEPKEGEASTGNLFGTAQLQNFHVVRAPALAKLFGLMSLGGLRDLLGQQGITFSKLEADFEWRFQPQGNLLLISNGRTSGSSVGLTFEGALDRGADTTDIRGTIIPMTEINNVLKNIPLLGEILTGGSGLIAATYTMKGPSEDPSVMVNPLSVLAPGFLRKLLFEGGFDKPPPQAAPAN